MARTDRASRLVGASPGEVFRALIDRDALLAWLPPTGMTARFEHFDMRPGGSYRLVLTYTDGVHQGKAGSGVDVVMARVVNIDEGVMVVQQVDFPSDDPAYVGTMTMTWSVAP
ncbi:MAG: SRPBCC domain-containing protein, partial [Actinomycetota bacterium]|nr:SRPBCC domain-containing protein [Actinomycetota bacterium]